MSGHLLSPIMTMKMNDKQTKLISFIRERLEYNKPYDNKIDLYEDTLVAAGLTKQYIALGLKKLADEGIVQLQQIFFAPDRTISHYETDTKYKVPADDFYKNPVYVLHINKKKLESLPSVSTARFVDNEGAIYFGDGKVELPPNRSEHAFCKVMFGYPVNEPVSWDVVYEEVTDSPITEANKEADKRFKHKIYDISRAINKRIKDATGIDKMFVWQGTTIKRTQ